jgi:hypothetical protein
VTATPAQAQSVDVGADIVNRYVWRGAVFAPGASVQPSLSFSQSGFTIGSWGSFSMSPTSAGVGGDELDVYVSYTAETDAGSFSVGVYDYFFPAQSGAPGQATGVANQALFDYSANDAGVSPHTIEPYVSFSGPVSVSAAINAYGTAGTEVWLEVAYPFSVKEVDLSFAVGGTPNDTDGFYFTDGSTDAAITKVSLSASREIQITEDFALPVFGSYYVNPYHESNYFIFGISL